MIAYIKAFLVGLVMMFVLLVLSLWFEVKDPDFFIGFMTCWAYCNALNFFRGQE